MKILISITALLSLVIGVTAQPVDKPLNNFHFDDGSQAIVYEKVFSDTMHGSAKNIGKRMNMYLATSSGIEDVKYDSGSNLLSGKIKNVHPKYFKGAQKELTGKFSILFKDGKYKVTMQDMSFDNGGGTNNGSTTVVVGYYGMYGTPSTETLESDCLNKKRTKWENFSFDIFPDLDEIFVKKFTIPKTNSDF